MEERRELARRMREMAVNTGALNAWAAAMSTAAASTMRELEKAVAV